MRSIHRRVRFAIWLLSAAVPKNGVFRMHRAHRLANAHDAKSRGLFYLSVVLLFAIVPRPVSAQAWIQLNPSGQVPPGILSHAAVYDPATNGMIVFGGVSENHVSLNEV
jgi:hypothetical protein